MKGASMPTTSPPEGGEGPLLRGPSTFEGSNFEKSTFEGSTFEGSGVQFGMAPSNVTAYRRRASTIQRIFA